MSSPEIDEIKNRLNIAEVVGEYIRLTKAGSNWKALCPFHNEKSPSFMVSEERGSWHCFGCGKGGDVFSFVMELEGIGFREALGATGRESGSGTQKIFKRRLGETRRTGMTRQELFAILELATKWYEKNLWEGQGKEKILQYLARAGLERCKASKNSAWATRRTAGGICLEFLLKKGYSIDEIDKTGLTGKEKFESKFNSNNQNSKFNSKLIL